MSKGRKKNTVSLPEVVWPIDEHNGWISPEGKIHHVKYGLHDYEAEKILKRRFRRSYKSKAALTLLNMGWIMFGGLGYQPFKGWKEPSQAQIDAIWDICRQSGYDWPDYLIENSR